MGVNIEKLEALAKAATPGLWKVVASDKYTFTVTILPPDFPQTPLVGRIRDEQDANYIVAACNSLPDLIAENRVLKERVQRLEMRVADYIEERDALVCTKYALEQQRDLLANKLACMCNVSGVGRCGVPEPCPHSKGYCRCLDVEQEEWVQIVKETGE